MGTEHGGRRFVGMNIRGHIILATEGNEVEAEHIEGGKAGGDQSHDVEHDMPGPRSKGGTENLILTPEASKGKDAADSQTADQKERGQCEATRLANGPSCEYPVHHA